jgi:hypothetical protein
MPGALPSEPLTHDLFNTLDDLLIVRAHLCFCGSVKVAGTLRVPSAVGRGSICFISAGVTALCITTTRIVVAVERAQQRRVGSLPRLGGVPVKAIRSLRSSEHCVNTEHKV